MKRSRAIVFSAAVAGGVLLAPGVAGAAPFLCPIVGDGVVNADAHNGDHGVEHIEPAAGTSLLPGNNQAGANANSQAHNTSNPDNPDAGPGGNSDFSPIWPG
jgi:hypothetical protein